MDWDAVKGHKHTLKKRNMDNFQLFLAEQAWLITDLSWVIKDITFFQYRANNPNKTEQPILPAQVTNDKAVFCSFCLERNNRHVHMYSVIMVVACSGIDQV